MKVAHAAIVTPGRCGLYETTRELVYGEIRAGLDARIVDPKAPNGPTESDRHVPIMPMEWAVDEADVIVSHSGHDGTPLEKTEQPIVIAAHGRPLSTFLDERAGEAPGYSYHVQRSRLERYRGCVTFWPEYVPLFRALWRGKPVHHVNATCDLQEWSPAPTRCDWAPGPTPYDFHGHLDEAVYHVVMADPWSRSDSSPFYPIHAFAHFLEYEPHAMLHLYAIDEHNTRGLEAIKLLLGDRLGVVQGWKRDLLEVYRAADMLITPHRVHTRSIRESMAVGLQVVSGRECNPEDLVGFADTMRLFVEAPRPTRQFAAAAFDLDRAGRRMKKALEAMI